MKRLTAPLFGLVLIFSCLIFLERTPQFTSAKQIVHSQSVPPEFLVYGTLGKIMKQLNFVYAVPRDFSLYPSHPTGMSALRLRLRQKSPLLEKYQFNTNPNKMQSLPSSLAISESDFKDGWPLLSIVVDEDNLYNPEKGILIHRLEKGQDWERLAYVSYYEDGQLKFASGAGLRIHGGDESRRKPRRERSFRLYFRNVYGINHIEPGVLFGPESKPIKHLVVGRDSQKHMPFIANAAFEIARRIGATVPESKPVLLFLNGDLKGTYFISEHVHQRQWAYHIGHENFAFYRLEHVTYPFFRLMRDRSDDRSLRLYRELGMRAMDLDKKMTMKEAGKLVDLDNLSRQIISIVFCGTTDWRQGAAVLDTNEPEAKWFWINWDMNESIMDFRRESGWIEGNQRVAWKQEGFELILAGKNWYIQNPKVRHMRRWDIRAILFSRLIKESPEYREYFVRLMMDILNHRLTIDFFQPLVDKYKKLANAYGFKKSAFIRIERYVQNRPTFLRKQIQQYFSQGKCYPCEVTGPDEIKYEIDSHPESSGYQGWYFKDKIITVKILKHAEGIFSHWVVNGKRVEGADLEHRVFSKTNIYPVFKSQD
ncbi:CotH kinase family protein [Acidobacteriota bacterium]